MHVEIWSDIACPWCAIGKRRFEKALAEFEHPDEVTVTWRSFELDPGAPAAREGERARTSRRSTGRARAGSGDGERMAGAPPRKGWSSASTSRAAATRSTRTGCCTWRPRTGPARAQGAPDARLPRRGRADERPRTLTRLALEAGLPEDEVRDMLATDRYAAEVREDERPPRRSGSAPCRSSWSTARSAPRAPSRPRCSASCCAAPGSPARRCPSSPRATVRRRRLLRTPRSADPPTRAVERARPPTVPARALSRVPRRAARRGSSRRPTWRSGSATATASPGPLPARSGSTRVRAAGRAARRTSRCSGRPATSTSTATTRSRRSAASRIALSFIDGMHLAEFVVRDFANVERNADVEQGRRVRRHPPAQAEEAGARPAHPRLDRRRLQGRSRCWRATGPI